ncbi:hypothetical protein HW555_000463 [Spodoptera exigua]|uniref:Uncharacterized protein n=1 Tax=Spodoptera exigua TaxID=7107 RepID=A0A835GSA8_SPOEX|nr:hypothetical protein HW555_000463 [Spodoptera exigua]
MRGPIGAESLTYYETNGHLYRGRIHNFYAGGRILGDEWALTRQREALTKERQHRLATGGGPSISDAVVDPDVSMVAPALIVGIDNATDSDLVEESSQSQIPDAIEIEEHYVIDDVSQTSVISHDQATEDHNVLPDSPIPSTSQMSQPFITTIPSAKKSLVLPQTINVHAHIFVINDYNKLMIVSFISIIFRHGTREHREKIHTPRVTIRFRLPVGALSRDTRGGRGWVLFLELPARPVVDFIIIIDFGNNIFNILSSRERLKYEFTILSPRSTELNNRDLDYHPNVDLETRVTFIKQYDLRIQFFPDFSEDLAELVLL